MVRARGEIKTYKSTCYNSRVAVYLFNIVESYTKYRKNENTILNKIITNVTEHENEMIQVSFMYVT